ncbi:unnamed protein product [Brassicogethes aeneus]|uniref:glutathione transferase n=1 Tax=Brassicogethes aeneus TaxID=1431903 RepID=A0A9P0BD84_BRAAE|nr:unnamed protein product [Brassicogethes aeneus]
MALTTILKKCANLQLSTTFRSVTKRAYKVTYFDLTALGEPLRFLCSYGNLDWEDFRVEYIKPGVPSQQWEELKPKMPYGQMPILEHEGKMAHQSVAISRFLAKKVGLVGKDDWEDLIIDSTVDTVYDFHAKIGRYHYETDPAIKESLKVPLFEEQIPHYLIKLDDAAKRLTKKRSAQVRRLMAKNPPLVNQWGIFGHQPSHLGRPLLRKSFGLHERNDPN